MERIQALELVAKISQSSFKSYDDFLVQQAKLEKQILEIRDENRQLNKNLRIQGKTLL